MSYQRGSHKQLAIATRRRKKIISFQLFLLKSSSPIRIAIARCTDRFCVWSTVTMLPNLHLPSCHFHRSIDKNRSKKRRAYDGGKSTQSKLAKTVGIERRIEKNTNSNSERKRQRGWKREIEKEEREKKTYIILFLKQEQQVSTVISILQLVKKFFKQSFGMTFKICFFMRKRSYNIFVRGIFVFSTDTNGALAIMGGVYTGGGLILAPEHQQYIWGCIGNDNTRTTIWSEKLVIGWNSGVWCDFDYGIII